MADKFNVLDLAFASNFGEELAQGRIPGKRNVRTIGINPDVDMGAGFASVWALGGFYPGFDPVTEDFVEVTSDNINDTAGGTGARAVVLIDGLDENYNRLPNEVLVMNGPGGVISAAKYLRLPKILTASAGSNRFNLGQITAKQVSTPANIFAVMEIGYNQSMGAFFTTAVDEFSTITELYASLDSQVSGNIQARLMGRGFGSAFVVGNELSVRANGSSFTRRAFTNPNGATITGIPPKTDFMATASSDTNNMSLRVEYDLTLTTRIP